MPGLENIRLLDLSRLLPGPYCTMLLADLGAEVIKVEEPGRGDYARELLTGIFYAVNRNKKSITVNLKEAEGREIIYRLAERVDVVVESFRPGVVARLKVAYEDLRQINPQIIYCSLSGYGQDGPYRLWPGHDLNYLSIAGVLSLPGGVDCPPARPGLPVVDLCAAMFAALAILSAFITRSHTGVGQYLDVGMSDAIFSWVSTRVGEYMLSGIETTPAEMPYLNPTNDVFETADGKQISLGVVEEHFWEKFCTVIKRKDLLIAPEFKTYDLRKENARLLIKTLRDIFRQKTCAEWVNILSAEGVPCSPVKTIPEAFADSQLNARKMITEIYVPELKRFIKQIAFPVKMSATSTEIKTPPPAIGQQTKEILTWLGYQESEIKELFKKQVI